MEMKGNNIDNLFKEGLFEHEVSPPEEVWGDISDQLKKKKSKKALIFWYRVAAGVTILIASTWFISKNISDIKNNTTELTQTNQTEAKEKSPIISEKSNIKSQTNKESITGEQINQTTKQNEITRIDNSNNTVINEQQQILSKENVVENNNEKSWLTIKNEEEQFGTVLAAEETHDNNSFDELALLDISLKTEIQEDLIEFDYTDIKVVNNNKNNTNQWEVGGYYAPVYSYRALEPGNSDLVEANSFTSNSEEGQVTYSGGFTVNYKVTKRLSIGTGLSVMNHSYKISNVATLAVDNNLAYYADSRMSYKSNQIYTVNNSIGQISASGFTQAFSNQDNSNVPLTSESQTVLNNSFALPDNQEIDQSFNYMEIPLLLRYKLIDKSLGLHVVSGVSSYFLINNKVTIKSPEQSDISGETSNIRTSNISGSIGLGLNYTFSKSLRFNMEPLFKIFLNSINTSNSMGVYPYTFGIYSGVFYSF